MTKIGVKLPGCSSIENGLELMKLISDACGKVVSLRYDNKDGKWKCTSAPRIGIGNTPLEAINSFVSHYRFIFKAPETPMPMPELTYTTIKHYVATHATVGRGFNGLWHVTLDFQFETFSMQASTIEAAYTGIATHIFHHQKFWCLCSG